jgi:menaquinone-dependent protoporphyrinogen oxidase
MKILLIYGTTEGHTRKIASYIADRLSGHGHSVALAEAGDGASRQDIGRFDAVLVAGSVHVGRYQPALIHFVRQQRAALDARPNAFISVSLAAAGGDPDDVQGLKKCLDAFFARTRWQPRQLHHVAGAFRYTAYGFFKRWAMRYIAHRKGGPTDTSRDHELTDWDDLARFVDAFAAGAAKPAP